MNRFKVVFLKHYLSFNLLQLLGFFGLKIPILSKKILFFPAFKIAVCQSCGYGVYERELSANELNYYYQSEYWNSSKSVIYNKDSFKKCTRALSQYSLVSPYIATVSSILEIGSASAFFTQLFLNNNPSIDADIIESGLNWHTYHKSSGLSIISDRFPFTPQKTYHFIHISHCLEHFLDLDSILTCLKQCLSNRGQVFVEVPNCDQSYWDSDVGDIPHIHFFTIRSLSLLFNKYGFKTIFNKSIGPNDSSICALFQL